LPAQTGYMAAVTLNVTNTTIVPLGPSDFYMLYADITVPANSSVFGLVDVVTPYFQSAVLTVMNMHVVRRSHSFLIPIPDTYY